MCNKNQFLQFTLAVFIIWLSSCEKNIDNIPNELEKFHTEIVENTNAKLGSKNTIRYKLYLDNQIAIERISDVLENFLQKEKLSFYVKDLINSDKSVYQQFYYNNEDGQFEKLDTKIERTKRSSTPFSNHHITLENIDWDINIYKNVRMVDRAVTLVIVTTICPPECGCICYLLE